MKRYKFIPSAEGKEVLRFSTFPKHLQEQEGVLPITFQEAFHWTDSEGEEQYQEPCWIVPAIKVEK